HVVEGLDLLAEPAAHLTRRVARRHAPAVIGLEEVVEQLHPAALELPGFLLAGVEAERQSRAEGEGWVLAEIVIARGVAHLDRAVCTASSTCRPGTISPAANTWMCNLF